MEKNLLTKLAGVFALSATFLAGLASCGASAGLNIVCTYDGEKFDWSDVGSSAKYEVEVEDDDASTTKTTSSSELEYDIQGESAKVSLKALDEEGNNLYSSDVPFEFKRLSVFNTPSYDHGTLSWEAVSNAAYYLVKVGDQLPVKVNDTRWSLNPGMNNDVCVKPVLDVSKVTDGTYYSYSIPQSYEVMATPTIVSFDKDSKTITWQPVKDAGGYYISIELDGKVVAEQGGIGANATYYNGYSFTAPGTYTVKIAATKNSNSNSYDSVYCTQRIVRLAAPQNLKSQDVNGSIYLSWDAVTGANKYRVVLANGGSVETNDTYYKWISETKTTESNFNFKIYASSTDLYTLDSNDYATEDVIKLGIPQNIKIQGGTITWDLVSKAQGYIVSVDGTEYNADKNEYGFDGYDGSHVVRIKAKGNGSNIVSSDYSESQTIYKLSKPTNLTMSEGVLSWDPVSNASSYKVVLTNGNSDSHSGSYSSTTNSITISKTDLRESQTIQVQAIGDGLTKADSVFSDPYNTFVLDAPVVTATTEGIAWTKVNNATSYTVKIGDYKKVVTGTALNLSEADVPAGIYAVTVTANGDLIHYFESDESQAISVKLLSKPVISENEAGTGVSWKSVTSAADYEVRVDDGNLVQVGSATRNYDVSFKTSGIHTISVRAVGDGVTTVTSGWSTMQINVEQLTAPTGFTTTKEGQTLKITADEVANASGYKFKIGGIVYTSETRTFEYELSNHGDFVISVAAIGTGFKTIDSTFSPEGTITVLNAPAKAEFTKEDEETYLLSWSPVNKAVSYKVEVTKTMKDGTSSTSTLNIASPELLIDTEDVIALSGKITAVGNGTTVFDSAVKTIETVSVK